MKTKSLLLLFFAATLSHFATAQKQDTAFYLKKISLTNNQMGRALVKKDIRQLMKQYDADAVLMPEFHVTVFGKPAIIKYYRQVLDSANVTLCDRRVYDLTVMKGYVIETGYFTWKLIKKDAPEYDYNGKYLRIWKTDNEQNLSLHAEIFGSVSNVSRPQVPVSGYVAPDTTSFPRPEANTIVLTINKLNSQVAGLVRKGDGAAFAAYYTDDAIYMPYYEPMRIGKKSISDYYTGHENPASGIDCVHIGTTKVTDLGDYVLVNGFYNVHWQSGSNSGTVTGKNISIWKRTAAGKLLIYRQMAVHD
ncbi:MAG TPA: nuclear transport factor 2 family protein [Mucilaginibacter sp.]|jgi:ketosteroid isomerase-like protein|nr:nuclear transport factor 2 family protein [Mucilaginibacter sp.]